MKTTAVQLFGGEVWHDKSQIFNSFIIDCFKEASNKSENNWLNQILDGKNHWIVWLNLIFPFRWYEDKLNHLIVWLNLIFQMVWGEISACFLGSHPTPPPARFNCCTFLPSHLFGLDDEEKIQISQSHWWGRANLMKYKCTKIISDFNISALHSINCEHAYHSNYEVFDHILKKS